MTPRDRLRRLLRGEEADRPAVLCPGGMMSMAVTEVMAAEDARWPESNFEPDRMRRLALAMQRETGFDSVALPFCMTVEAEAYGATIDPGNEVTQPKVKGALLPADGAGDLPEPDFASGRAGIVAGELRRVRDECPDLAVIGNVVGPLSLLGMLADPLQMLRWVRKRPDVLHRHLQALTGHLVEFGRRQVEAGVDAVCIADPTATGEILGGPGFAEFALPYLARLASNIRDSSASVMLHICGDVRHIMSQLRRLRPDAMSFDSVVDLVALRRTDPPWQVMGNLSPFLLEAGPVDLIRAQCRVLRDGGVPLIAPACGVVPTTPLAHLRAVSAAAAGPAG